ncbi:DUF2878 family protein [Candidatus Woesearchaeota archaeon]|nr:DUF2878 family protein [Candidatus Woesearchaeota archaeon]MBI2660848.1 DUF2878 family protein [Candidatus Woesearchaeota archaeon]
MRLTRKIEKEVVLEIILFSLGIASISLFYENNLLLTLLLALMFFAGMKFWHKKQDFFYFISGAVIGPIAEVICIYFGVWQYVNPSFLGIPVWLPLIWGLGTILIKRIAETIQKLVV